MRSKSCIMILLLSASTFVAHSQILNSPPKYYFYRNPAFGSDATFNPVSLIFNGGFDELQSYGRSDDIGAIPWRVGAVNVWRNISDPIAQVELYGSKRFITDQILPTSLNKDHGQWFPNYTLHLLGGGMAYRKAAEWFDFHGYPAPYILSAFTSMTYHYVNEIIENGDYKGTNVDPIPDLLLFDPLGIILFSFDGVAEFFSSTFTLNDWSYQPAVSFGPIAVRNAGQNFVMKYPITQSGKTSLFYHFGNFGMLGLSVKTSREESISVGAGVVSKSVYRLGFDVLTQSIQAGLMIGVYFDRNNSLLASVVVMDSKKEIVRANIFPGLLSVDGLSPGLFASVGVGGSSSVGLTAQFMPVGLGMHFPR